MRMKLFVTFCVMFCFVTAPSAKVSASAMADVKTTVDNVLKIIGDKELKNTEKRRKALRRAIGERFDYSEMAKRSMAAHWKKRTPAEQKEFVGLFETLLENSYANKIESYNNEKILYLKEIPEGDYSEVKTKVVTAKRDEFTLDYRLMNKGGKWLIYDVVIEGVSLVSNYRTQFNKVITSQGYGELLKKLRNKSEEIKAP